MKPYKEISALCAALLLALPTYGQNVPPVKVSPPQATNQIGAAGIAVSCFVVAGGATAIYVIHTAATRQFSAPPFPAPQDTTPYWDWNKDWARPNSGVSVSLPSDSSGLAKYQAIPANKAWVNPQTGAKFPGIFQMIIEANSGDAFDPASWHDYTLTGWIASDNSFVINYCGQISQGLDISQGIYLRMADQGPKKTFFRLKSF